MKISSLINFLEKIPNKDANLYIGNVLDDNPLSHLYKIDDSSYRLCWLVNSKKITIKEKDFSLKKGKSSKERKLLIKEKEFSYRNKILNEIESILTKHKPTIENKASYGFLRGCPCHYEYHFSYKPKREKTFKKLILSQDMKLSKEEIDLLLENFITFKIKKNSLNRLKLLLKLWVSLREIL